MIFFADTGANPMTWIIGTLLVSYLIGSIPFGLIAGYVVKGVDIRQHGSRNIGATNAARVLGTAWFPVVMLLDAVKGAGPCLAALLLSETAGNELLLFAAAGALLGHFFSIYLRFRGGKGVATGLGVVMVVTILPGIGVPLPALCALGVFALTLWMTRIVSIASIVAALSAPAWYVLWLNEAAFESPYLERMLFLTTVAVFVVFKHRGNIRRVMRGQEPRLGSPKPEVDP